MKEDVSLTHSLYKEININEFLDKLSEEDEDGITGLEKFSKTHDVKKCMFIFDDIAVIKVDKKKEKMLWLFIDMVLENKRKAEISICVISHISCNYRQTALITREAKNYVFSAKNMQSTSDRMLKSYMGISGKQLKFIMDHLDDSRWVSINTSTKTVISEFVVYSLKDGF